MMIVVGNVIHVPFRSFRPVRPKAGGVSMPVSKHTESDDESQRTNFKEPIARHTDSQPNWDPIEEVMRGRESPLIMLFVNGCWLI